MNQLIPITTASIGGAEVNAVDARALHAFLGVRPTFLFDWLRSHDWITARNEPYSERVKQNVLRPRVSNFEHPEKGPSIIFTAHVTPKGLFRIYQSLLDEGLVSRNDQLEMTFAE